MFAVSQAVRRRLYLCLLIPPTTAFAADPPPECRLPPVVEAQVLVQRALDCNARLEASEHRWRSRRAQTEAAGRLDDPRLGYSVAPDTAGAPAGRGEVIELSQTLPWPGRLGLEREAAEAEADASRYQWQNEQVRLARRVRHAYADWTATGRLLTINRQHRQLWREFVAVAEAQYAAGRGTKHAVLQASTRFQHLKHRQVQLEARRRIAEARLNRLLNRPPDKALGEAAAFSVPELSPALIEQRRTALEHQPSMRRLQAEQTSAAARAEGAEKARYPDFTLMARRNTMWMNPDHQNMVGVSINIPLDFGKRSGRIDSLRAEQDALRWQQRDLENQLQEQIARARAHWDKARHILQLHENDLLPLAEETLTAARDEYRSGAGGFLALLTAEQSLLQTHQDYENARREVLQRHADLLAALGLVDAGDSPAPNSGTAP